MLAPPRPECRVRGFYLREHVVDCVELGWEGGGREVAVGLLFVEGEGGGPDFVDRGRGGGGGDGDGGHGGEGAMVRMAAGEGRSVGRGGWGNGKSDRGEREGTMMGKESATLP